MSSATSDIAKLKLMRDELLAAKKKRQSESPEFVRKEYYADPLGFVMSEWPWGEPGGPLQNQSGPDTLQKQFLIDLGIHVKERNFDSHTPVAPIKMSISASVGCGKSTMGAFITWWILRTRPLSVGTVTSGNYQQLEERTWSDIMYWGNMAKGAKYFEILKSGVFHRDIALKDKWKVTPKTAKAENAQAFAGQHATTSTSWFLFDESSEVPDNNWLAAYGCIDSGEPMFFAWGQMIQSSGEFYKVTFGDASDQWDTRVWDGRDSAFTSKEYFKELAEEWGEDSDYFRVRVRGLPPRASSLQFIQQDLVDAARERTHSVMDDEPLIVGYDAANGGLAKHVFAFRKGLDAKSIPPITLPGDTHRDRVVAVAAEIMSDKTPGRRVTALFGDQAFGAVILERLRGSGFTNCFECNFGSTSIDKRYLNMRAQMWGGMKEWLYLGSIPDDEKLAQQLMSPGFGHRNGKLVLESKESMSKRRIKSPDWGDALACTFYRKVSAPPPLILNKPVDKWANQKGPPELGWML